MSLLCQSESVFLLVRGVYDTDQLRSLGIPKLVSNSHLQCGSPSFNLVDRVSAALFWEEPDLRRWCYGGTAVLP